MSTTDNLAKAIDKVIADHAEDFGPMVPLPKHLRALITAAKRSQELQEQLEAMTKARDLYKEDLRKTVEYYEQQRNVK